jgi:hypothetical protein
MYLLILTTFLCLSCIPTVIFSHLDQRLFTHASFNGASKVYLGQPSASVSLAVMNVGTEQYAAEVPLSVAAWLARRALESSVPTSNHQHERSTAQLFYAVPATD